MLKPPLTLRPKATAPVGAGGTGPVAWWKLDEASGATVANAAGTNLTGQLKGQPRWAADQGRFQGALEFDGASTWVECPDSTDLGFGDGFSLSLWFKAPPDGRGGSTLLAKGSAWQLAQRRGEKPELELILAGPQPTGKTEGPVPRTICPAPTDGQWHHLAGVYDGTRAVLYLDGVATASTPLSGPVAWNNVPVSLGGDATHRDRPWSGWLDDVRLYARAISAAEVKALQSGNAEVRVQSP
ncbi:MAG: LamG domain-containing protein [Verrucomicrobiales bacterium]|nr:LamG domain-containing protein [Verrucomicrobiales bacterium]